MGCSSTVFFSEKELHRFSFLKRELPLACFGSEHMVSIHTSNEALEIVLCYYIQSSMTDGLFTVCLLRVDHLQVDNHV